MDNLDYRYFEIRTRFRVVKWEDIKNQDVFYYHRKSTNPSVHGPFVMMDPETCTIKNGSDVVFSFEKSKDVVQPMVLDPEPNVGE